jgi:predicted dehydrogenase
MRTIGIGIIGGGLMGREAASAFSRWCALLDLPFRPRLVAVADPAPAARAWFSALAEPVTAVADYRELLALPAVEVVYAAVPHHLHEAVYLDTLTAGKDLLAEKPFGIDLPAAQRMAQAVAHSGRFVRVSSEMPYFPGAQRVARLARSGALGRLLGVVSGFHHSSDLDPDKPANWKRQSATCGEIGVLGDLGLHVCHLPFRLGWEPSRVFAQLSRGFPTRPDGRGGRAPCDTWDNALVHTWTTVQGEEVPLRFEMKRLAPGATNTWFLQIEGTRGGARFSTAEPKTLWTFEMGPEPGWKRVDLGFQTEFKTVTGGIFEPGFPDVIQQMWAAFLAEREGVLGERFGCATVAEALLSQRLFAAALHSHNHGTVSQLP